MLLFQVCTLLVLPGDGAVKGVTVRNCYIYYVCFFDGSVKYNYVQSIVMDSLITHSLQLSSLTWTVAHIYNMALVFPLTVHI
jgi:hypothetical protein